VSTPERLNKLDRISLVLLCISQRGSPLRQEQARCSPPAQYAILWPDQGSNSRTEACKNSEVFLANGERSLPSVRNHPIQHNLGTTIRPHITGNMYGLSDRDQPPRSPQGANRMADLRRHWRGQCWCG